MASDLGRIILVKLEDGAKKAQPPMKFAAFVPMTIALLGVAAVLFGGVSAGTTTVADRQAIDPIATGSIAPAE